MALLAEEHRTLRDAIAEAPWSALAAERGDRQKPAMHVYGAALHDTYHAGQIRTIRALYKQRTRTGSRRDVDR